MFTNVTKQHLRSLYWQALLASNPAITVLPAQRRVGVKAIPLTNALLGQYNVSKANLIGRANSTWY